MVHQQSITLATLLRYLYQRTFACLEASQTDDLMALVTTIGELTEAVDHLGDREVFSFLDKMSYVLNEWSMNGPIEVIPALRKLEPQLEALEQR